MGLKKPKIKLGEFVEETPEAIKSLASGFSDSVKNDVLKGSMSDAWNQFFGEGEKTSHHSGGDLSEGQELDLEGLEHTAEKAEQGELAIEYRREILHGMAETSAENTAEIRGKIEEIKIELRALINTVQMQVEYGRVIVEQTTEKPGKYHETFFVWLLAFIRSMKAKVEDSGAWLATSKSKKQQKSYWNQFEEHGTSFGMSNERNVATQTG